jgi:uncharacterized membrane protein YphA (DoxX/SURF4 family)
VTLGVFFLAMGASKVQWFFDTDLLAERFARWLPNAAPYARWYLENVAIPAAPLFARLVPAGELCAGVALVLGIRVPVVSAATLAMVLNFHVATSAFSWEFLRDGTGPPVLGALVALIIGGRRLPFCLAWPATFRHAVRHSTAEATAHPHPRTVVS